MKDKSLEGGQYIFFISAVFTQSTGAVSDENYLEITPAGWTFSIWGFIYAWQVLWIAYGLSTICREGINGYLYYRYKLCSQLYTCRYICLYNY